MGIITKFIKEHNKGLLNASFMLLSALIALSVAFSFCSSLKETSCNNQANRLLLNKTQAFVDEQYTLFEETWAKNAVAVGILSNDSGTTDFWADESRYYKDKYELFLEGWESYDELVFSKLQECQDQASNTQKWSIITFILIFFQLGVAICYFSKF
ncbi:MAG: hypothetical protein ABIJ18_03290 [archaeon]